MIDDDFALLIYKLFFQWAHSMVTFYFNGQPNLNNI